MNIIETQNLTKIYRHKDGEVAALKNVSLSIENGGFAVITGHSGSGKSTLLLTLAGLIRPSSGSFSLLENNLTNASDNELAYFRRKNIGFVMQSFALIPYLTTLQNIILPLLLNKVPGEEQHVRAKEAIEAVGLTNRLNHYPRELSAGQQQRVAIARAIVNNPAIIFADEPTGNLDPALATEILEYLKSINTKKGTTVVMVTHSAEASAFGNIRFKLINGELSD